jgi:hypothetical protein
VYREETQVWRDKHLRVYPALGNHELSACFESACFESACLDRWWGTFPELRRLAQDGVTYLVSGGGGATPYEVDRTAADLYQDTHFPNYHYVRFELRGKTLRAEMIRLQDYTGRTPSHWLVKDRFEISLQP